MLIQFDMLQYLEALPEGKYRLIDNAPNNIIERAEKINADSKELYGYDIIENVKDKRSKAPNGDYSEVFYFDAEGNLTDEKNAVGCVIRECQKDGTLLRETYGICNRMEDNNNV